MIPCIFRIQIRPDQKVADSTRPKVPISTGPESTSLLQSSQYNQILKET